MFGKNNAVPKKESKKEFKKVESRKCKFHKTHDRHCVDCN